MFPLVEIENGEWRVTVDPPQQPIENYLTGQGRFRQLAGDSDRLEGLSHAARELQRHSGHRRAIVAVITEGPEFSTLDSRTVLDRVEASGAALHVLALDRPEGRTLLLSSNIEEIRHRSIVIADGTVWTGGRREQAVRPTALSQRLQSLADELLNQYVVTYDAQGSQIAPERIEVSVRRADITVRARTR